MRITGTSLLALVLVPLLALPASGALSLLNGGFDDNPVAGSPVYPDAESRDRDFSFVPDHWYTSDTSEESLEDGVYGPSNYLPGGFAGAWSGNGIALWGRIAINVEPDPPPPPVAEQIAEDGYFYTSLDTWAGEDFARIDGTAHRTSSWEPPGADYGNFLVSIYYTDSGGGFTPDNGVDIAATGTLVGEQLIDISYLWGAGGTNWSFTTALEGVSGLDMGDTLWLKISDGPDDGTSQVIDLPIIDNLSLSFRPPGDVDDDGDVDSLDADVIIANFGKTFADFGDSSADLEDGDLVDDDVIDMLDFQAWRDGYPYTEITGAGAGAGAGSSVPEPASAVLFGMAAVCALLSSRRRTAT